MKITNCLIKKNNTCHPIWFMRQAGRYLPEFQKIRSQNKDFIKLCLDSDLSSKITLQPIDRFDLDAAIIFSDILIVPYALGQKITFEKDKGPSLSNMDINKFCNVNENTFVKKLKPVYDAIEKTRKKLNKEKALISFVGAPWTLAIYMLGLKLNKNSLDTKAFNKKKADVKLVIQKLNDFLCIHIKNQIDAGADTIQIFDSWAGLLPNKYLNDFCYQPNMKLVDFCKRKKIPVICFPKGLKENYSIFNKIVKSDGLNIDYDLDPEWAKVNLKNVCIQGGMNPNKLLLDEKKIYEEAEKYLKIFKNHPYIFNLGHGLLPSTDPDKLSKLIKFVKNYE